MPNQYKRVVLRLPNKLVRNSFITNSVYKGLPIDPRGGRVLSVQEKGNLFARRLSKKVKYLNEKENMRKWAVVPHPRLSGVSAERSQGKRLKILAQDGE